MIFLSIITIGCESIDPDPSAPDAGAVVADSWQSDSVVCAEPTRDYDGDGLSNRLEGCDTDRDSDGDRIPDWQDFDSDDDKIPDSVEAGTRDSGGKCADSTRGDRGWPCDHDGDKVPDMLDRDSDGDGLPDGVEDRNGDGELGCCLRACQKPGLIWQRKNCALTPDGCGAGQTCQGGQCSPARLYACSEGETDPRRKDTFGDGRLDNERPGGICQDATAAYPTGRRPVQLRHSSAGDWHVALEKTARYGALTIAGATQGMAAGVIDLPNASEEVAGFVAARPTTHASVQPELDAMIGSLILRLLGHRVTLRASGTLGKTHDQYDTISRTVLDLTLAAPMDLATARATVIAAFLGKDRANLSNLPQAFGAKHSQLVVRFSTVRRFEFKRNTTGIIKDSKGFPIDSGDKTRWKVLVIGAVVAKSHDENPARRSGILADDLANGTALGNSRAVLRNECDVGTIVRLPKADFIWVVDESGSIADNRDDVVRHASTFFKRAQVSGLDFRMGVTGVVHPPNKACIGKFCSVASTVSNHDGGKDRFLLPSELSAFSACVKNPPCYEGGSEYPLINAKTAVTSHLPRAPNDPKKIRKDATLVLIVATDEISNSLYSVLGTSTSCPLPAHLSAPLDKALQPYLDLFMGVTDPEAAAMLHTIGTVCSSPCTQGQFNHGLGRLSQKLGGNWIDICQKSLGNSLQVIIDDVVGKTSPIKLDHVPISSSLAVTLDAVELKRSRTHGFDYRANANSLVFINAKYKKGSEVMASYKRWAISAGPPE